MRILWLTPLLPLPPDTGGKRVTFQWVRHLAVRGHQQVMVACAGSPPSAGAAELAGVELHLVPFPARQRLDYRALAKSLLDPRPYALIKYWDERNWQFLREVLRARSFDVLHLDHLHVTPYGLRAQEAFDLPVVLTTHNVESELWTQAARAVKNPFRKAYLRSQAGKVRSYERQALARFDLVHALSAPDAQRLRVRHPGARLVSIPPGVERKAQAESGEEAGMVAFVGAMHWWPNEEGVRWFHRRVWPRVERAVGSAHLCLVGGHPPRALRRLARGRVSLTGWVHDVGEYLARAQVVVVPLLSGSGVRVKLLEALALGKAVVSTPLGAQGLEVESGQHLWVEASAPAFAERVVQLLLDPDQRRRLGQRGRARVRARYGWERSAGALEAAYRRLVAA